MRGDHWKHYMKPHYNVAILDGATFTKWAEGKLTDYECLYQFRLNNGMSDEIYIDRKEFFEWLRSIGYIKGQIETPKKKKCDKNQRYEVHNLNGLIYIGNREEIKKKMNVHNATIVKKLQQMREGNNYKQRQDSWWLIESEE